jgi:general secretion pathway protein B
VFWFWQASAPQAPATVAQPAALPPLPAIGVAPATVVLPAPKAEIKPTPTQVSAPTPAKALASASASASASVSAAATAAVPRPLPAASKVTVPVAAIPAAPATQAVAPKVAPLSELPEDLRRQIPPLVITGVVYSDSPAQSLLLVNKLVLTQGNLAAPEVMLERIHLHHAVFSFRGTQFTLSY